MSKGLGLVKSRDRFRKMVDAVPERKEHYLQMIAECEAKIVELGVCKRCGRPLKSDEARAIGYGKECLSQTEKVE